ncbi:MAG: MFS transporter [Phenylobacterium sp.]|jgi:Na+/melibiose symporter-like transporter|uniref:MFS transporter n=1 Tax=Phenylobacterium sp. TaxID=1871053 RepID=UPI002A370305|nr:MFS transporter [Phenylobacterium sp.]MDX9997386.1 MFS transporter [Phenylobacterium sp.]
MTAATTSTERKLGAGTKLLYALGATATSLKGRALSTFLLIFYNQVVGLPPKFVGMILMVAIIVDAVVDPLVGQISDNFKSRWGRRHPFMIAAALPYPLAFFLLWNPPTDWSDPMLLGWLATLLIGVRILDTFFELPHQALAPELAYEYDSRTRLMALRHFFTVIGGLGMQVMAYQVFLRENPDGSGGVLARDGYFLYSLVGALIIFATMTISTLGTLNQVPHLRQAPARKVSFKVMVREVIETLSNRTFLVITGAAMFISIAVGVRNGLELYIGLYFWNLTQPQLATLATVSVIGGFLGTALAPFIASRLGKKIGLIAVFGTAVLVHVTPVSLRLLGLAPPNGTPELLALIYGEEIFNSTLAAATGVILASLVADVVEDAEVKTGRRSEGLLLSATALMRKVVSSAGPFIATLVLTLIAFPVGAERKEVAPEVLHSLGLAYVPTILGLYGVAIAALFAFNISRQTHEENLRKLREAAALAETVSITDDPEGPIPPVPVPTPAPSRPS